MATNSDPLGAFITAFHILHRYEILSGLGSLSIRNPQNPATFLTSGRPAVLVSSPSDIIQLNIEDGSTTDLSVETSRANDASFLPQRFIHSCVYKHYRDVHAIVHGPSVNATVYGLCNASGSMLRVASCAAGFINHFTPVFDPARHYQDLPLAMRRDLLISNQDLGYALAQRMNYSEGLGNLVVSNTTFPHHSVAMLRGQGAVCCGKSLQEAVYKAIEVERNANIQTMAMLQREGTDIEITYFDQRESRDSMKGMDYFVRQAWACWSTEVARSGMYNNELLDQR